MLNRSFPYTTSFKVHMTIGMCLGSALGFILVMLEPYDTNNFEHPYKTIMLSGYGFALFSGYILAHCVANRSYNKLGRWNWWDEISFQASAAFLGIILAYFYHDSVMNNQPFSILRFLSFFLYIALPIFPLLIFPKLLLRYLFAAKSGIPTTEPAAALPEISGKSSIRLKGENKGDEIVLQEKDLLFVRSNDNYVQVFYRDTDKVRYALLRSTLAGILEQADFLIQPHRSYLINPKQAFHIKGNSQKARLILEGSGETIPISRTSYTTLKNRLQFVPEG